MESKKKLNWNRYTYSINHNFFKKWNPNMVYILGFTCADGNVYKTTLRWDLSSKYPSNLTLLKDFNRVMNSNYPIKETKHSYQLRISNSEIVADIMKLGIIPNKKKILEMPKVPRQYERHFIRGFLEGDGWITVTIKRKRWKEISIGFSNGSLLFMQELIKLIKRNTKIRKFNLRTREKITPNKVTSVCYSLEFYADNAFELIQFLYDDLERDDLYLKTKFEKQKKARKFFKNALEYRTTTLLWRKIEKKRNIQIKSYLSKQIKEKTGVEIAKDLNVSSATIYRWLEKTNVRKPIKRTNVRR